MTSRREWLKKSSLWLGAGLLVGDDALAMLERLTHKPIFALGGVLGIVAPKGSLYIDRTTGGLWVSVITGSGGTATIAYDGQRAPGAGWVQVTAA